MTPQELRNSILQLAIQGKLVPQRPEDGSAADLLREIREQRERENVAASPKRFRRTAMETTTPSEEPPFEIPETWAWIKATKIIKNISGNSKLIKGRLEKEKRETNYPAFSASGQDVFYEKYEHEGDALILSAVGARCGKAFKATGKWSAIANTHILIPDKNFLRIDFSMLFLNNEKWWIRSGTAQPFVSVKESLNRDIPLPPLAEQKRIVAKIEELMPLVDRYEKAWNARKALDKRFPEDLQKSLLQLAIQGKLVPQNPADGNAEDLFRQIQEQRNRENAAAPKRSRRASAGTPAPVSPDEIPFDIPETWKWVKFVDAIKIRTNLVDPKLYPESIHIAPDNIEKGSGKILEFHSVREDKVKSANHFFKKGQILYSKIRPLLRKATIAPFDGLCSADMYPLETPHDKRFVLAYLLSDGFNKQVASIMSSRVKMPKINQEELSQVLFPLPPPAEQQRIAAKLADILPLCEKLSSHAN